jgi:iron complex outermembrane receptor protein
MELPVMIYRIVSVDSGLRYDYSSGCHQVLFEITMGGKRLYGAIRWFYSGEQGNQWLTKPSFTFHNISASVGFHKEFEAELNWYANISLANENPNPSEFFSDGLPFYRDYRVG